VKIWHIIGEGKKSSFLSTFYKGVNIMTTLFKLREHLMLLLVEDKLCFAEGDWDRLDRIRLAIDDTRDQIAKIEKA
jgi:hypothetical protein